MVLVDFQQDFWPDDVESTAPELPARVTALLAFARSHDLAVVHLRARFRPDGSDWMARYRLRGRIPCIEGTPGVDTLPFATEHPDEPVIIKHSFDGFLNTDLHEVLTARGIRALMIAGLVTSTCVLFTASTATQLGYHVSVLSDCCSDYAAAHAATLAAYPFIFDTVASTNIAERRDQWDTELATMRDVRREPRHRLGQYPPHMDLRMSEGERQAFLAGVHIGVISIEREDGPPLTVPIWYGYEPGGNVWVTTGTDSLKSKLLNKAQRFSLCVQTEEAPFYSYVSVEGPVVSVEPTDEDSVGRPMAHRYFGAELGDLYVESIKGEASLTWTMRPERWWSVDYAKTGRVDPRTS